MILTKDILTLTIDDEITIYHNNERAKAYTPDGAMLIFDPDAIVGWNDSPEIKRDSTARPLSHGDFGSQSFYEGKLVTITGHALVKTPEDLVRLRHKFVGTINDGMDHTITVSNSAQSLQMQMSQGSRLTWIQQLDNFANFKLDLYASDPRMYGSVKTGQSYSQSRENFAIRFPITYPLSAGKTEKASVETISNNGNTEAWPIYTINATLPSGFSIQNGGKSIVFSGPTFAGTPVVVDTYKGSVTVDGSDRSYQLTKREWSPIPAYGTLPVKFQPLVAPTQEVWLDISWRDTWI